MSYSVIFLLRNLLMIALSICFFPFTHSNMSFPFRARRTRIRLRQALASRSFVPTWTNSRNLAQILLESGFNRVFFSTKCSIWRSYGVRRVCCDRTKEHHWIWFYSCWKCTYLKYWLNFLSYFAEVTGVMTEWIV